MSFPYPMKLAAAAVLAAAALLAGCAQAPTAVLTVVSADDTVPPLELVQVVVTSVSHPSLAPTTAQAASLRPGDGWEPASYLFPVEFYVGVDPSFAGEVSVTVQGLDWNTMTVIASGTTTAQVVAEQKTQANVVLTAVCNPMVDGDAGACDGGDAEADGPADGT